MTRDEFIEKVKAGKAFVLNGSVNELGEVIICRNRVPTMRPPDFSDRITAVIIDVNDLAIDEGDVFIIGPNDEIIVEVGKCVKDEGLKRLEEENPELFRLHE